jgi:hypothetical protein
MEKEFMSGLSGLMRLRAVPVVPITTTTVPAQWLSRIGDMEEVVHPRAKGERKGTKGKKGGRTKGETPEQRGKSGDRLGPDRSDVRGTSPDTGHLRGEQVPRTLFPTDRPQDNQPTAAGQLPPFGPTQPAVRPSCSTTSPPPNCPLQYIYISPAAFPSLFLLLPSSSHRRRSSPSAPSSSCDRSPSTNISTRRRRHHPATRLRLR